MTTNPIYCPKCKTIVEPKSKSSPFCSERCRLIDLGNWASEKYSVPAVDQSPENVTSESSDDNPSDNELH
jgi:endogenous inhibitor of DNA gyrase (YacG/DUF329 family)